MDAHTLYCLTAESPDTFDGVHCGTRSVEDALMARIDELKAQLDRANERADRNAEAYTEATRDAAWLVPALRVAIPGLNDSAGAREMTVAEAGVRRAIETFETYSDVLSQNASVGKHTIKAWRKEIVGK